MPKFNLDEWWAANVDPEISPLDNMYKQITQEAIDKVKEIYGIKKEEEMEEDSIDLENLDLSDLL